MEKLRNLGPVSMQWLAAIGVTSLADVKSLGSVTIYRLLKQHGYRVSLNLLYALEGAILDCQWNQLPPKVKLHLQTEQRQIHAEFQR